MSLYVSFDCESCENENCTGKGLKSTVYKCDGYKHTQTNADRIRAMTDEELAHLLHSAEEHLFTGNLWNYEKWTEWLKQEASDAN